MLMSGFCVFINGQHWFFFLFGGTCPATLRPDTPGGPLPRAVLFVC